jgi:hypothetical protein
VASFFGYFEGLRTVLLYPNMLLTKTTSYKLHRFELGWFNFRKDWIGCALKHVKFGHVELKTVFRISHAICQSIGTSIVSLGRPWMPLVQVQINPLRETGPSSTLGLRFNSS